MTKEVPHNKRPHTNTYIEEPKRDILSEVKQKKTILIIMSDVLCWRKSHNGSLFKAYSFMATATTTRTASICGYHRPMWSIKEGALLKKEMIFCKFSAYLHGSESKKWKRFNGNISIGCTVDNMKCIYTEVKSTNSLQRSPERLEIRISINLEIN